MSTGLSARGPSGTPAATDPDRGTIDRAGEGDTWEEAKGVPWIMSEIDGLLTGGREAP